MKNIVIGLALCGLAFACKSQDKVEVSDPSTANVPAECAAGECSGTECCAEKAECSGEGAQVCPVTGAVKN